MRFRSEGRREGWRGREEERDRKDRKKWRGKEGKDKRKWRGKEGGREGERMREICMYRSIGS